MNEKPTLSPYPMHMVQSSPLMDMSKIEEMRLQPANEILNRTNFYAVMDQFSAPGSPPHIGLLLSPQVARDLSIFDEVALQRAIKMHFGFCSHALAQYPPSPTLWFYSKMAIGETGGRAHLMKSTWIAKGMGVGAFVMTLIFCLSVLFGIFFNDLFYAMLALLALCIYGIGCWLICRIKPMEEYNLSYLQQCPMIDYVQC